MTEILRQKLKAATEGWITLVQVPIEQAQAINVESIHILQEMQYTGIYISLTKDYVELHQVMQAGGVDLKKLIVIDGISEMYGIPKSKEGNVVYVAGPLSIDLITEKVRELNQTIQEQKKFVFLDSLTTVLLYNSLHRTVTFGQFLINMMQEANLLGIMVSVSTGQANNQLIDELKHLATEVIDLRTELGGVKQFGT